MPDGRLLVLGGMDAGKASNKAFFQDTQTGALTDVIGTLVHARAFHSATLLPNGKVLIFGGTTDDSTVLTQAEIFDPGSQTFSAGLFVRLDPKAASYGDDAHGRPPLYRGWNRRSRKCAPYRRIVGQPFGNFQQLGRFFEHTAEWSTRRPCCPNGTVMLSGGENENGIALDYSEIIDTDASSVRIVSSSLNKLEAGASPRITGSIPQSGETNIGTNQVISLRFSTPMNVTTLNSKTITLRSSSEDVEATVVPAESGMLAFVTPLVPLQSGTAYTLTISSSKDLAGRSIASTTIVFTTEIADATASGGAGDGSSTGSQVWPGEGASSASGINSEGQKFPMLLAPLGESIGGPSLKTGRFTANKCLTRNRPASCFDG